MVVIPLPMAFTSSADHRALSGKLLRVGELFPRSLEQVMVTYGLPEADATPAAAFIRSCLHLNPEERPTAEDLLDHSWLETAYMCC